MTEFILNNQEPVLIPFVADRVPAGFPSPAADHMEEPIDIVKHLAPRPLSTFFVCSVGDSMTDAFIPEKAILIVDKSLTPKSKNIVVAYLNGGFTIKFVVFRNEKVFLVPANKSKSYPVTEVTDEMNLIIWGVVTHVITETKHLRSCMPW